MVKMQEMTTDNKLELAAQNFRMVQESSKEMTNMCRQFAEVMTRPRTCIKCEIDAQNKSYESVRADIEEICAEHEGKRELEITIKNLSASEGVT